jgi:uncharacterized membrane protein
VLIYLITQHEGMAKRNEERVEAAQTAFDERVRSAAGGEGGAAAIEKAEQLLAKGTINEAEFERLKAQAIAGR